MNARLLQLLIAAVSAILGIAAGYFTGQKTAPDPVEVTCEMAQALLASEACAVAAEVPSVEVPAVEEVPSSDQ